MVLSFGPVEEESDLKECIKNVVFASGGNINGVRQLIENEIGKIGPNGEIGGVVGGTLEEIAETGDFTSEQLERFKEGLPQNEVLPSKQLRPPINVKKTATDITGELQSRCTGWNRSDKKTRTTFRFCKRFV